MLCELIALEGSNTNRTPLSLSWQEMEVSVPHHIQIHERLGSRWNIESRLSQIFQSSSNLLIIFLMCSAFWSPKWYITSYEVQKSDEFRFRKWEQVKLLCSRSWLVFKMCRWKRGKENTDLPESGLNTCEQLNLCSYLCNKGCKVGTIGQGRHVSFLSYIHNSAFFFYLMLSCSVPFHINSYLERMSIPQNKTHLGPISWGQSLCFLPLL